MDGAGPAVRVVNEDGRGRFVVVCDHASRHIPEELGTLGLAVEQLERHIAWDPGALPVATFLAQALDAPLIHPTISRLVVDVNRSLDAADFIAQRSENTQIPGNRTLDEAARRHRIITFYEPYHAAIETVLARRENEGLATALISIHTFTPVFRGQKRAWHVGVLHGEDTRISAPLAATLAREPDLVVGDNQPYSPSDGVYYTLARHSEGHGAATVMIEIRNDLVADERAQRKWAERLASALAALDLPARAA